MMKSVASFFSSANQWVLQPLLVVAIIIIGFVGANQLSLARPKTVKRDAAVLAPLVEIKSVNATNAAAQVRGYGSVVARGVIDVVPQVSGRVVAVHPNLVAGGLVPTGEALFEIESIDYELARDRALADESAARASFAVETANAEASLAEWRELNPTGAPPPLVAREPQLAQIQSQIQSAEARVREAELDLERTRVTLPFDARVVSESIEMSRYVSAAQAVASAYDVTTLEVRVPVPDHELAWIQVPGVADTQFTDDSGSGSPATIVANFGGTTQQIPGVVNRIEGEVDPRSRQVTIVIALDRDAPGLAAGLQLRPGVFVEVLIEGRVIRDVVPLDLRMMRTGQSVWRLDDGVIRIEQPDVIREEPDVVYVRGLPASSDIVVSELDIVTNGMNVRLPGDLAPDDAESIDNTTEGADRDDA